MLSDKYKIVEDTEIVNDFVKIVLSNQKGLDLSIAPSG